MMPKGVEWSKQVALELIKAGYFSLAKKSHPDHGGSHEKMLVVTATKEYLEGVLNGNQRRKPEPEPPPRRPKHHDPRRPESMVAYAVGWWMIADVDCIRTSDKAVLVAVDTEDEPIWFPKSQLHRTVNEVWEYGDEGTIVFSEWIARQKGWL
jgi:hypothetical protein